MAVLSNHFFPNEGEFFKTSIQRARTYDKLYVYQIKVVLKNLVFHTTAKRGYIKTKATGWGEFFKFISYIVNDDKA